MTTPNYNHKEIGLIDAESVIEFNPVHRTELMSVHAFKKYFYGKIQPKKLQENL